MSGVPERSSERGDEHPLVIAGGAITYLNPEPLADFIDIFILGEGEAVIHKVFDQLSALRGSSKNMALTMLKKLQGIYIPSLHEPHYGRGSSAVSIDKKENAVEPFRVCQREIPAFYHSSILTADTEFKNTLLTEIMRGCPYACSFCAVGNSFGTFRPRQYNDLARVIENLPVQVSRVGLIGASINCHPAFEEMLSFFREKRISVGFSSLRLEKLNARNLEAIMGQGNKTLTLAPECGNEILRWKLHKCIQDDDILAVARESSRFSLSSLRLYYMIGLPGEADEDVYSIIRLTTKIIRIMKLSNYCRISVSINQFVPKAETPMERAPQENITIVEEKIKRLKKDMPREVKLHIESPRLALVQGLLARGDRRLSGALSMSAGLQGFSGWERMLAEEGLDSEHYLREWLV